MTVAPASTGNVYELRNYRGKAAGGRIFEVMQRQPTIDLDAQGGWAWTTVGVHSSTNRRCMPSVMRINATTCHTFRAACLALALTRRRDAEAGGGHHRVPRCAVLLPLPARSAAGKVLRLAAPCFWAGCR